MQKSKTTTEWFLLCDTILALYMLSSCVCLSVCHTPVLYQNG